jgi:DNA/RNA-binding domain of Phe-tRNA-synthetase-like protein
MEISVLWNPRVTSRFFDLAICIGTIKSIHTERENDQISRLREELYEEVRTKYDVETLKDEPTVRAYRDLYWRLDIDATKTRPSGESLLRRVLHGNELPNISTVVDAYNLASMKTIIPISGFDLDLLAPPFEVRFAEDSETFTGIGTEAPIALISSMLILADKRRILCIYPYRDSDYTKITLNTEKAAIVGYGAPGIQRKQLKDAVETTLSFIRRVSGGEIAAVEVFS